MYTIALPRLPGVQYFLPQVKYIAHQEAILFAAGRVVAIVIVSFGYNIVGTNPSLSSSSSSSVQIILL
jgi:hypothetical protein